MSFNLIKSSLVAMLMASTAFGESPITLTLEIANRQYPLTFSPELAVVPNVALDFCLNNGGYFGITEQTLRSCTDPVEEYLTDAVKKRQSTANVREEPFTIEVEIASNRYQIVVNSPSELDAARRSASDFCAKNAGAFGLSSSTLESCTAPLAKYLESALAAQPQKKPLTSSARVLDQEATELLTVDLDIAGSKYQISFPPATTRASEAARDFCMRQAAALGISENTLANCVGPVAGFLEDAVQRSAADKKNKQVASMREAASPSGGNKDMLTIELTVANQKFRLLASPETSSAGVVAERFCVEQGANLGVTQATLPNCIVPVTKYVQEAYDRSAAEKKAANDQKAKTASSDSIDVELVIGAEKYVIKYFYKGSSVEDTSRAFCVQNGEKFGLSEATLMNCVNPVMQHLQQAIGRTDTVKKLTVPLVIGSTTYDISFEANEAAAVSAAQSFCNARSADFGLTQSNLQSSCVSPVLTFLKQAITA